MSKKSDKRNRPAKDYSPEIAAIPKKHPKKKIGKNQHVPADLRALEITDMLEEYGEYK